MQYYNFNREQLSVYTIMFIISHCEKNFVILLVVGLRYIFYAQRSAMFTIDWGEFKAPHC